MTRCSQSTVKEGNLFDLKFLSLAEVVRNSTGKTESLLEGIFLGKIHINMLVRSKV